jgi:hypothetical protein
MKTNDIDLIINNLAEEMSRDVDRELLWDILTHSGWTRVSISRLQDNNHAVDITRWLEQHVKNPFERNGKDFIFENHKDATLFILTWL